MSALTCDHCGAETTNGLALCSGCRGMLLLLLEFVPVYFHNLSRWRPSSASGRRNVPGSREPRTPNPNAGDRIGRILDESHADLTGWARTLADDRPELGRVIDRVLGMDPEPCVRLLCALLTKRVATLTTLPWVRDLVQGIRKMERRLRIETEISIPGWYAGACRQCESATYVVPGLTWVTCNGITGWTDDEDPRPIRCGVTTAARDHLPIILNEARVWTARPSALAAALVALVDTEQSVPRLARRISKWGERGKITPVRFRTRDYMLDFETERIMVVEVEAGYARYRFGEVFDRLMTAGPTRLETTTERMCS